jgi:cytochrome o ubiquinol oxidase operon protein cyoD
MDHRRNTIQRERGGEYSRTTERHAVRSYGIGYGLSIVSTLAAAGAVYYYAVAHRAAYSYPMLVGAIVALAIFQLVVQLVFFLDLNGRRSARWNLTAFVFMAIIVSIVAAGSLWIMSNLDYNMTPAAMNAYMLTQVQNNSL